MEDIAKRLYPMRFGVETGITDLAGQEAEVENGWLAGSTVQDVMETYLERVVGENVYDRFGRQFPLSVKMLHLNVQMPLVVCPDDEIAYQRYDTLGKTKFWYVVDAEPGSRLYMGFKRNISAQELYERCLSGTLEEVLNEITPRKGEGFIIPPGLVHSASPGLVLAEVTECSDLDFRIYNWGNPVMPVSATFTADPAGLASSNACEPASKRGNAALDNTEELSLAAAFDFLNMNAYDNDLKVDAADKPSDTSLRNALDKMRSYRKPDSMPGGHSGSADGAADKLVSRNEFTVSRIRLNEAIHIYMENLGSFIIYICVSGEASFQQPRNEGGIDEFVLKSGEVLLIPEEVPDFFIVPRDRNTVLLESFIEPYEKPDTYIDTSVSPEVEE